MPSSGNRKLRFPLILPSRLDCGPRPQRQRILRVCSHRRDWTSCAVRTSVSSGRSQSSNRRWTERPSRSIFWRILPRTFRARSPAFKPGTQAHRHLRTSRLPNLLANKCAGFFRGLAWPMAWTERFLLQAIPESAENGFPLIFLTAGRIPETREALQRYYRSPCSVATCGASRDRSRRSPAPLPVLPFPSGRRSVRLRRVACSSLRR